MIVTPFRSEPYFIHQRFRFDRSSVVIVFVVIAVAIATIVIVVIIAIVTVVTAVTVVVEDCSSERRTHEHSTSGEIGFGGHKLVKPLVCFEDLREGLVTA